MRGVLEALAEDLRSRGGFDLEEAFIDGSFAPAKKGTRREQNQARKRNHNHGRCRPPWSSDHGLHPKALRHMN
jgi:hypothetical protein